MSHYTSIWQIFLVTYLLLLICLGCGKKEEKTNIPKDPHQDTALNIQTEEVYYVWVDNLRARKKPGLEGEIIRELRTGEKLIYLQEKSTQKEIIQLRGKPYEDYWLKVKLPGGEIGWVFGGALTNDSNQVKQIITTPSKMDG